MKNKPFAPIGTVKGEVDRKWVKICCNCIIRKQKKDVCYNYYITSEKKSTLRVETYQKIQN